MFVSQHRLTARCPGAQQAVVEALIDLLVGIQTQRVAGLIDIVMAVLTHLAEGLDADRQASPHCGLWLWALNLGPKSFTVQTMILRRQFGSPSTTRASLKMSAAMR